MLRHQPGGVAAGGGRIVSWLQRLKSHQTPQAHATKPTEPGFVGFVAPGPGESENSRASPAALRPAAANAAVVIDDHQSVDTQRCSDCLHLLRAGTCSEPVLAGLITAAEEFAIVWPPAGHAASCAAFGASPPSKAQERPYRLTPAQGDAAHSEAWDDGAIARFQARVVRVVRLGFDAGDADDLAERLHLRDVEGDHRSLCIECLHYRPGRCGNHRAAGLQAADVGRDLASTMQHCGGFKEIPL